MDYPLPRERQGAVASVPKLFLAVSRWLAATRARRARRAALAQLLDLDVELLRDIGLERRDIIEAMNLPHTHAASLFESRRRKAAEGPPPPG